MSQCRKSYTRQDDRPHHSAQETDAFLGGKEQRSAYNLAFNNVCDRIQDHIVLGGTVECMTMLREKYLNFILENSPEFYNQNHQTSKLKAKLISHFGDSIQFWLPNSRKCKLVYSSNVDTGEAVEVAFEAATSEIRILEDAAMILRRHILNARRISPEMPWPPSTNYLESSAITPPDTVTNFIAKVQLHDSNEGLSQNSMLYIT